MLFRSACIFESGLKNTRPLHGTIFSLGDRAWQVRYFVGRLLFYGEQANIFSFYRFPKVLFTDSRFRGISVEAKVLYGLLLDRMGLSVKNGWKDEEGRVYIIFTVEAIMEHLGCSNKKAVGLLRELDEKADLIERRRQGQGRPSLIYVKNFIDALA